MMSTHWARPHQPSDGDYRFFDILARIVADFVERAHTEQALRESEERFRSLAEQTEVGVAMADREGRLIWANSRLAEIAGQSRDELTQLHVQDYTHPGDWPENERSFQRMIETGTSFVIEKRINHIGDAPRWNRISVSPRRDPQGFIIGGVAVIVDITGRVRAEDTLRESEERFRSFADASEDVLWIVNAATRQLEYLSPAYERIWGEPREAVMADLGQWAARTHPDDLPPPGQGLEALFRGERYTAEYRVQRRDGGTRYVHDTGFPIFDENGQLRRVAGIAQDLTERRVVELALAESERRARSLMEGIPQLVWRSDAEGQWTWSSPQWQDCTGQAQEESHGLGWLDALHPDDREMAMQAWAAARPHDMIDVEYRVHRVRDGAFLWHHTRAVPVRDDQGRIVEWLGTTTDVQELKELQEHQAVLVAELQHRTRNLMGVVRSMADKTARASADPPDFRSRFRERLEALSRVQGLLSRLSDHDRVTFDELIETELAAIGNGADRVRLEGPRGVRLRSSMVQTLAMALHELATNAVKYGALGQASGQLIVTWRLAPTEGTHQPRLHIDWRESGVEMPPAGSKPSGGGQGRELIEKALPYQLSAKTTYELGPDGVHCTISIPISTTADQGSADV